MKSFEPMPSPVLPTRAKLAICATVSLYCLLSPAMDPDLAGVAMTYSFLLPYFVSLLSDVLLLFISLLPALERPLEEELRGRAALPVRPIDEQP